MLMMMRADESYTPVEGCSAEELLACITADDYDACIAECNGGEEPEDPIVTKKGTLNVSAVANNWVKAIIDGVSELDTIKLNASEAINVEKVTLERYGYTKNAGVKVWLENTDGVVISNEKELTTTKDDIALTIKKDFRDATDTKEYVIVADIAAWECDDGVSLTETACTAGGGAWTVNHTAGETIWFKVTDVVSSAETLKIASYTPTEYTLAVNNSSAITATLKGKTMTYNYAEWESYQVAKVRVQASNAEISVNGLTIRTAWVHDLDLKRFVDKVEVLWDDGIALRLSATDVKADSIKVTFPAQTIAAKKNADFTILLKLKDFDMFGQKAEFDMADGDLAAIETKTSTRVNTTVANKTPGYVYTFEWSKIKVTNTNLWNVSAAKWANDVVVAEWTIEINEPVELNSFTITPTLTKGTEKIESLELWLNGSLVEEATLTAGKFVFPKTLIEKSGKLQFVADIDDTSTDGTVTFSPFNKTALTVAGKVGKYDESGKSIDANNFAGAITFSRLNIEFAKWNLENTLTKKVEIITDWTSTKKVVFDGTYTASKGDVYLNEMTITETAGKKLATDESISFYLTINGEEVSDSTINNTTTTTLNETFGDVLIKKWEKATIKVEAEVVANTAKDLVYELQLDWEDADGAAITPSAENMTTISLVTAGSVTVVATTSNDVMLRWSNVSLAKFTVKSNLEWTRLVDFAVSWLQEPDTTTFAANDIKVTVDWTVLDSTSDYTITAWALAISAGVIDEAVDSDGIVVEIIYKWELADGTYNVVLDTVNTSTINKTFTKYVVPALVKVTSQENLWDTTKYTFSVEKADESYDISALTLSVWATDYVIWNVLDWQIEELNNSTTSAQFIDKVTYTVSTATPFNASILKTTYKDYFRLWTSFLKIFKAKDE